MSIKDFTILAKLGQGAYSTVYKVERLADGKPYALKKVKLGTLSEKQAQNALNQVRILASIRHQNIVSYKEAFIEGKSLCIVMEFADDGDLYHKILERKQKKQYFEEHFIWKVIIYTLRGLKELHDLKIFHRDLKTANIFLNKNGKTQLGDMNVSKIAEHGLLYTQTGTPYYASPEVWSEKPYDTKSDIWSLGCVFYEMVCLDVPFKAEDMEGLSRVILTGKYSPIPNIYSKELAQLIYHMIQLKPKNRPGCQKLLKYPVVQKKVEELHLNDMGSSSIHQQLLSTIKMPRKLQYLTDRLPKSNYSLNLSYQNVKRSIVHPKRPQRQRTNTLPKLQKVIRYHEDIIHKSGGKPYQPVNRRQPNSLCVQGHSKNINEIRVGLPDRRDDRKDRIQQEISRIYQGKHAVYKRQYSRQILAPIRK